MYQSTLSLDIHRGYLHRTDSALFVLVVRFGKEVPKSVQWTSREWRVLIYMLGRLGARACYKQVLLVQSHSSIYFLLLLVVCFYRFWWQVGLDTRIHWVGCWTPLTSWERERGEYLNLCNPPLQAPLLLAHEKRYKDSCLSKEHSFWGTTFCNVVKVIELESSDQKI